MSDPDPAGFEPLYEKGIVNPRRQLFMRMSPNWASYNADAIQQIASRLEQPTAYVDTDGYEIEITAAALHPTLDRMAWVISRAKELDKHPLTGKPSRYIDVTFHLQVMVQGRLAINWEPYSYNLYFGVAVRYFEWHGDHVILIYREKHETVAVSAHVDGNLKHLVISDKLVINDGFIAHLPYKGTEALRLSLPDLTEMSPLSEDETILAGLVSG